jgi:two-component sensor histidine kinase
VTRKPAAPKAWTAKRLRQGIDAAGVALWSWNVDSDHITLDEAAFHLWGVPEKSLVTFVDLSSHIHPADRDRVRSAFVATRAISGSYEIDFRIMVGHDVRWISARGKGDDADIAGRVMFGVFLDVTGRKQAEEGNELLAGEMSHRVKNLLMIATALTAITSRSATSAQEMATELTRRLSALGRAHDLVRPMPGKVENGALLGDLLSVLLAPYDDMGAFSGRIRVSVPRMAVGEIGATTLAMVLHELATNSLKYGALSCAEGTLDVSCDTPGPTVDVVWAEHGGPAVEAPSAPAGFGSKLLQRGMNALGGKAEVAWVKTGVVVTLHMSADRLRL